MFEYFCAEGDGLVIGNDVVVKVLHIEGGEVTIEIEGAGDVRCLELEAATANC